MAVGEISGSCEYKAGEEAAGYTNWRQVRWTEQERQKHTLSARAQACLFFPGTICEIEATSADVPSIVTAGEATAEKSPADDSSAVSMFQPDVERMARVRIADRIIQTTKGHALAALVEEILRAKGFFTFRSPEGPDDGVDILAAPEPMGFGHPRICVQVKSGDGPLERAVLDQLIGVMRKCGADHGLLVSWGGFRRSFDRDERLGFFQVRLWDRDDLVDQFMQHYAALPEDRRAEIPLKQVWTLAEDSD